MGAQITSGYGWMCVGWKPTYWQAPLLLVHLFLARSLQHACS